MIYLTDTVQNIFRYNHGFRYIPSDGVCHPIFLTLNLFLRREYIKMQDKRSSKHHLSLQSSTALSTLNRSLFFDFVSASFTLCDFPLNIEGRYYGIDYVIAFTKISISAYRMVHRLILS